MVSNFFSRRILEGALLLSSIIRFRIFRLDGRQGDVSRGALPLGKMASLLHTLPAPSRETVQRHPQQEQQSLAAPTFKAIPPYLHRANFIPRKPEDFGDGGAFPEIHVSQ